MYFKYNSRKCEGSQKSLKYIEYVLKSEEHIIRERNDPIVYFHATPDPH